MIIKVPKGKFGTPVKGGILTSGFGPRVHPITGASHNHNGVDFGVARGTPITSTSDGVVTRVVSGCKEGVRSCGGGFGNHVFVKHKIKGKTYESVYAHLNSVNVKQGQKVKGGQVIGKSGNTGDSSGPHLHFEIHVNGFKNPVNPRNYIKF